MFPVIAYLSRDTLTICFPSRGCLPRLSLCHSDVIVTSCDVVMTSFSLRLCFPFVLAGLRYAQSPTRLLTPLPIGRYSRLLLLRLLRLFVLVVPILVYILGWRWDDPHLQSTLQPP